MTDFEQKIRDKIAEHMSNKDDRNLFKLVLGEWQLKTATKDGTDEIGYNIVRKIIKANEENLGHLAESDPRYAKAVRENELLQTLMPSFLSPEEVKQKLSEGGVDVAAAKNTGQAMGLAMKYLKGQDLPVEGDVVKQVVEELRSA